MIYEHDIMNTVKYLVISKTLTPVNGPVIIDLLPVSQEEYENTICT